MGLVVLIVEVSDWFSTEPCTFDSACRIDLALFALTFYLCSPAGSPFVDARAALRVAQEQAAATDGQRACGGEAPS